MGDQRGVPWEAGNFVPLFSYTSREIVKGIDSYINNGSLGLFLLLQLWIVSSRKLLRSGEARWHYGPKRSCAAAAEQDEAVQVIWSTTPLDFHRYQQKQGQNPWNGMREGTGFPLMQLLFFNTDSKLNSLGNRFIFKCMDKKEKIADVKWL